MNTSPLPSVETMVESGRWGRVRPGRRYANYAMKSLTLFCTCIALVALLWILGMLIVQGGAALSATTLFNITPGPGSVGGGLANAIVGSFILSFIGIAIATPLGVMAGTYLAEYGRGSKLASLIRFVNDVLLSAPSILIGLFVYIILVMPFRGYSGWAGGVALAIIATPVIVRTTEDMLRLIPASLREAGAALGAPPAHVIIGICWRAAKAGIVTGALLALARISGETAPLLFTALNNPFWFNWSLTGGVSNLPVTIYQFASAPYDNWRELAWAGALIITISILALSTIARLVIKKDASR
jgi:phosphate transport system permease protein